ncbi:hypothetical protein Tco_0293199, partial [Tanacetum coccineum]
VGSNSKQIRVALAGPNPEHMQDVFLATNYPKGGANGPTIKDTSITQADLHPSVNPVVAEPGSAQSTSGDVSLAEPNQVNQPPDHLRK